MSAAVTLVSSRQIIQPQQIEPSRLSASALYQSLGWSILPVDGTTKRNLVPWKAFTKTQPSALEVSSWGQRFPKAGIGVIAGPVSGILVLDADGQLGLAEVLRKGLPTTPTVITPGGGLHAYFKWPAGMDGLKTTTSKKGESHRIDARGDGGYVVAPYTARADGKRYTWHVDPKTKLAPAPKWFLELLASRMPVPPISSTRLKCVPESGNGNGDAPSDLDGLSARLVELITRGHDLDVFPSRSECDLFVVVGLVAAGRSNAQIVSIYDEYPIGEKYQESGIGYLNRTIDKSVENVRDVTIKYADYVEYSEGARLQLCLTGDGGMFRTGVTAPIGSRGLGEGVQARWTHFWQACALPAPFDPERIKRRAKRLIGVNLRVEVRESRQNQVVAFYRA